VPPRNLITIVVDRLHAGMVGAYGNSWIRTSELDELASQSMVFDFAFATAPDLSRIYRALWSGMHPGALDTAPDHPALPAALNAAGLHTTLVTDEAEVAALPAAGGFAERVIVESVDDAEDALDVESTQSARLFAAASDWLAQAQEPFALWIHARGMAAPWDAPLEMRNAFADEEDPDPPKFAAVPNRRLPPDFDPDELLGITHAYAGQLALVDSCLGAFLEGFAASPYADSTLLTFLSARGFPLGEHLRVGPCDDVLFNELTQLVWMMRFPDGLGKLVRSQALVAHADLPATLMDWLGAENPGVGASSLLPLVRGDVEHHRDRLWLVSRDEQAIRTPAWLLRRDQMGSCELYAKPSDRWEVSEVSKLCPHIVEALQAALAAMERGRGEATLAPLDESLVTEVD
jgi:arylsulfatase A-like enzyme